MSSADMLERDYRKLLGHAGLTVDEVASHLKLGDLVTEWSAQKTTAGDYSAFPAQEVVRKGLSKHLEAILISRFLPGQSRDFWPLSRNESRTLPIAGASLYLRRYSWANFLHTR